MKNTTICSLFFLCLFLTNTSSAAGGKYDIYYCGKEGDVRTCSGCTKSDKQAVFKVLAINNVVIRTVYKNGELESSLALENCKVADEDNWGCDYNRMIDGKFISSSACGIKQSILNFFR